MPGSLRFRGILGASTYEPFTFARLGSRGRHASRRTLMQIVPFRAVIGLMIVSMALVAVLVTAVAILLLYRTAHDQELAELQAAAETLAGLTESVAQFDQKNSADAHPDGSWGATMSQIEQGLVPPSARRPSQELIIGRRVDGRIQVLRRSPVSGGVEDVATLDPGSGQAQPLGRALEGQSGSGELIDYAGNRVLAGYAYVPSLDVGIVYKVDLDEVRAPYIRAAAWSGLVALAAILVGAASFVVFARPLRRQAEQPERRLQSLIAAAPVGVYETDARGACTFVNEQWCALTGLRPEQALGDGWAAALHHDDADAVGEAWQAFVAGREAFAMEYRFCPPGGEPVWVYGQASPILGRDGNAVGYTGTVTDITARKQADEALRTSERRLRSIIDGMFAYVALYSPDGVMLEANNHTLDQWGLTREQMIGRRPWETERWANDPKTAEVLKGNYARVAKGESIRADIAATVAGGRRVTTDSTLQPLFDEDGNVSMLLSFATDITDRKRAEEALRASEAKYRELIEQASDGIFLADSRGRYVDVNEAACSMLGYTREELLRLRILDVVVVDDEALQLHQTEALDRGEPVHSERLHRRKDGTVFPVEVSARRQSDGLFQAITRDITDRKRADEQLRESEGRFRTMVESFPSGVLLVDSGGKITLANRRLLAQFGYSSDELAGQNVELLVPDSARAAHVVHREGYARAQMARQMGAGRDLWGLRKDGAPFPVEVGLQPIEAPEGPLTLATIVDISERKRAEETIIAALREKETLLKEVHHRVKNNLAVVVELLTMQSYQVDDPASRLALAESVNRVYAISLVHELIYQSDSLSSIDFGEHIARLAEKLLETYEVHGSRVELRTEAGHVSVTIDQAVPCSLILNELVTNALKHAFPAGSEGLIEVALHHDGADHILLEVRDNGVGMSPEVEVNTSRSLGLRLISGLTRQLGGAVDIVRGGPGTAFRIRFPVRSALAEDGPAGPGAPSEGG